MATRLDGRLKAAELEKVLNEVRKVEVEIKKIQFENAIAEKEETRKWWEKSKFWQQFLSIFLGITFLGFYITYIIVPTSNISNLKLELENQRKEKALFEKQNQLSADSLKYNLLIRFNDSLKTDLENTRLRMIKLSHERDSLDLSIRTLAKLKDINNSLSLQIQKVNSLLNNYKKNEKELINQPIAGLTECYFRFYYKDLGKGKIPVSISKYTVNLFLHRIGEIDLLKQNPQNIQTDKPIYITPGTYRVEILISERNAGRSVYQLENVIDIENSRTQLIDIFLNK